MKTEVMPNSILHTQSSKRITYSVISQPCHHFVIEVQVVKVLWYVNERMWLSGLAWLWAVSHGMTNIISVLYKYGISYLPCGGVVTEVEEHAGKPVIDFI